jgi:tRNA (cmo5U34)-methyltransferase
MARVVPFWRLPPLVVRERLARGERPRVPEPMVMDEEEAVADFDEAGATAPALIAIYEMCARSVNELLVEGGHVLDLGSGSAVFLEYLAERRPDATLTGLDLSEPMLETGRARLERAGLSDRVRLINADVTKVPHAAVEQSVDLITCLNLLHQLPDAETLDATLAQIADLRGRFGAGVFIMDLARLRRADTLGRTLDVFEPNMPPLARKDAIASEAAAYTVQELDARLAAAGLGDLALGKAVPLEMWQIRWAPPTDGRPAPERWRDTPMDPAAARLAKVQRFKGLPS